MTRRKLFALFASLPPVGRLAPKPEFSVVEAALTDPGTWIQEPLAYRPVFHHYVGRWPYEDFLAAQAQRESRTQMFHATLAEALEYARPGDEIVIAEGHQEHKDS